MDRPGLVADRRGAGVTLEYLGRLEPVTIVPQFGQQARRQLWTRSRQRAKQLMIGVLSEKLLDLFSVFFQLRFQEAQLFGACHGQTAFGLGEGVGGAKVGGFGEAFEPFFIRLGSIQLMGVEEFIESGVCQRRPAPAG